MIKFFFTRSYNKKNVLLTQTRINFLNVIGCLKAEFLKVLYQTKRTKANKNTNSEKLKTSFSYTLIESLNSGNNVPNSISYRLDLEGDERESMFVGGDCRGLGCQHSWDVIPRYDAFCQGQLTRFVSF